MKKINVFLNILKFVLLVAALIGTIYIMFFMYQRLGKSFSGIIISVLPYILLLILFVFNNVFSGIKVNQHMLYNFICCFSFSTILFCCYRAIFDDFMLIKNNYVSLINFSYYSPLIKIFNILMYGLVLSNILIIILNRRITKGGFDGKE